MFVSGRVKQTEGHRESKTDRVTFALREASGEAFALWPPTIRYRSTVLASGDDFEFRICCPCAPLCPSLSLLSPPLTLPPLLSPPSLPTLSSLLTSRSLLPCLLLPPSIPP